MRDIVRAVFPRSIGGYRVIEVSLCTEPVTKWAEREYPFERLPSIEVVVFDDSSLVDMVGLLEEMENQNLVLKFSTFNRSDSTYPTPNIVPALSLRKIAISHGWV